MKNIKNKILITVLSLAILLSCFSLILVFGVKKVSAGVKIPSDYVSVSDSATFEYQALPDAYKELILNDSKQISQTEMEKINVEGAMVFSATNSDTSNPIDVSMTFSTILSAKRLTKGFNLFEYVVITDELGVRGEIADAPEFECINLTLASKNNPSNYICISNYPSRWHNTASIIRASAKDMQAAGKDRYDSFYDTSGFLSGSGVNGSLSGCYIKTDSTGNIKYNEDGTPTLADINSISYKFDTESMIAYAYPATTGYKDILVRDFDNPNHLIGLDKLFEGFESDELVATLSVEGLIGKVQLAILNFNGAKLYGNSADDIVDVNNPDVFATNYFEGIQAEVGVNFPVFEFKSYDDIDGLGYIDGYKVYYNYGLPSESEVLVNDGVFVPEIEGKYTIVAEKADSSGNVGTAIYNVEAKKMLSPFKISLLEEIENYKNVGEYISLPTAVISGGTAGIDYSISVWYNGKQVELDKFGGFTIEKQGLYTIKYSVYDYRNVPYDFNYFVEAKLDKTPIVEFPNIPKYVAVGNSLIVPKFKAIDWYSYAGISVDANVSATINKVGGELKDIDDKYVFTQAGDYQLTLTAKALKGSASVSKTYDIKAIKTEKVLDYFVYKDVEIVEDSNVIFKANNNGANIEFINSLPVTNFAFKFNVPEQYSKFTNVEIVLTDRYSLEQSVTINCRNGYIDLCGNSTVINSRFGGSDFALSLKDNVLKNGADVIGNITNYDNGEAFQGFTSGFVFVELKFNGINGDAGLQIKTIGNHSYFAINATDISAPFVNISEEIPSIIKIGEIFRVPEITAYDVFEGEKEVKISILKNNIAISLSKDNSFLVNDFGTYVLRIETVDTTNHKTIININLYCHNYTGPTITVLDKVPSSGSVGSKITLPEAFAVDYFGNEVEVRVVVLKKGGEFMMINEKNQFTPNEQTEYVVRYTATDSEFNTTTVKFIIKV